MVKSYQRYVPSAAFGVIASPTCNVVLDAEGGSVIVGALEEVAVWHIKRGVKVRMRVCVCACAHARVVAYVGECMFVHSLPAHGL